MHENDDLLNIFEVEMKRGALTLATLSQLHCAQYGYSLLKTLTDKGVEIEAGTLYPMLRRLEKQGVLKSDWDTTENRPRKYYVLSEIGKSIYKKLEDSWKRQVEMMRILMEENEDD